MIKYITTAVFFALVLMCGTTNNRLNQKKASNEVITYLDPTATIDNRVKDLMSRMTLEEKVYQMCQYVGLEHMKEAEAKISPEELEKNDALGFYPGMRSGDIGKLAEQGKVGSFLHVVTAKEANELQHLAQKSFKMKSYLPA